MNSLWILSIILLISMVYGYDEISMRKSKSESRLQLKSIQSLDECKTCKCKEILKKAKNLALTPIRKIERTWVSEYQCDPDSIIKVIKYHKTFPDAKITCNGQIVQRDDDSYDVVFADSKEKVIHLTNYTQISDYVNGNLLYLECGTIKGGRCSGDQLLGIGTYVADKQNGCCTDGNTGTVGTYRSIEITGKCASQCSLLRSVQTYKTPITN